MRYRRWLPALVVPLVVGALVGWSQMRQGYPDAVYHYRYQALFTAQGSLQYVSDTWIDPQQHLVRLSARDFVGTPTLRVDEVLWNGIVYDLDEPHTDQDQQLSTTEVQRYRWIELQLQLGGFQGLSRAFLAHAQGAIAHTTLYGHAALRFSTATPYSPSAPGVAWLDAHTDRVLQIQWFIGIDSHIERFVQQDRLAPGALPADFFGSFHVSHSFWDTLLNWAQDRLG